VTQSLTRTSHLYLVSVERISGKVAVEGQLTPDYRPVSVLRLRSDPRLTIDFYRTPPRDGALVFVGLRFPPQGPPEDFHLLLCVHAEHTFPTAASLPRAGPQPGSRCALHLGLNDCPVDRGGRRPAARAGLPALPPARQADGRSSGGQIQLERESIASNYYGAGSAPLPTRGLPAAGGSPCGGARTGRTFSGVTTPLTRARVGPAAALARGLASMPAPRAAGAAAGPTRAWRLAESYWTRGIRGGRLR